MLQKFKGYFQALEALFPNIGLERSAFNTGMLRRREEGRRRNRVRECKGEEEEKFTL